jgi:hypothetical protein
MVMGIVNATIAVMMVIVARPDLHNHLSICLPGKNA